MFEAYTNMLALEQAAERQRKRYEYWMEMREEPHFPEGEEETPDDESGTGQVDG